MKISTPAGQVKPKKGIKNTVELTSSARECSFWVEVRNSIPDSMLHENSIARAEEFVIIWTQYPVFPVDEKEI